MSAERVLAVYDMAYGADMVVAYDEEDAWAVWSEQTGCGRADHEPDEHWVRRDGTSMLTITDDDGHRATQTCADWAAQEGRCFLCSTEW